MTDLNGTRKGKGMGRYGQGTTLSACSLSAGGSTEILGTARSQSDVPKLLRRIAEQWERFDGVPRHEHTDNDWFFLEDQP